MKNTSGLFLKTNLAPYQFQDSYMQENEHTPKSSHEKYIFIPSDDQLKKMAVKQGEFEKIFKFFEKFNMDPIKGKKIIKRNESNLPYSVGITPKDIYVLLKKHRLKIIGEGSVNSVTLAWSVNNQALVVFRTCNSKYIGDDELMIYRKLSTRKDLFVATNDIFNYLGPSSARKNREPSLEETRNNFIDADKLNNTYSTPKEGTEQKVGLILEYLECTLGSSLRLQTLDFESKITIAIRILEGLDVLHNVFAVVHFDLKSNNILLTKERLPKIADYGNSCFKGGLVQFKSSRSYLPPEFLESVKSNLLFPADFSVDMWSYGVLLLEIFFEPAILVYWNTIFDCMNMPDVRLCEYKDKIANFKKFLEKKKNENPQNKAFKLLPLLYQCLDYDPNTRISAEDALSIMRILAKKITLTKSHKYLRV